MVIVAFSSLVILSGISLLFFSADIALRLLLIGWGQLLLILFALKSPVMRRTQAILLGYSVILVLISTFSYYQSIMLGTAVEPYLGGSDGQGFFVEAMIMSEGNILENIKKFGTNYSGYQVVLASIFDIFGRDLIVGLLLNNTVLLLVVIFLAKATFLITRDPRATFYASLAFMLTTKFVFYSNTLLKEPFLVLGVALLLYAFIQLKIQRHVSLLTYVWIIIAIMIFSTMRIPMLVLIPLTGLFILGRHIFRKTWLFIIIGIFASDLLIVLFSKFTYYEFIRINIYNTVFNNTILSSSFEGGVDNSGVVGYVMSSYEQLPLLARIVTIPIPVIIQYVLPFNFWSMKFLEDHFISLFNINLNIIWYLFVGVFAFYTIFNWKRLPNSILRNTFLIGGMMYMLIAFVFGGVVPRYASPYLLFIYPTIGYWMSCWSLRSLPTIRLKKFFWLYYLSFLAAVVAYLFFMMLRFV